ncbi:MAG: type I-E CRISPR-associated protein Cse1/CasA [Lentisphaeria bacterium]
MNLTTDPWIPVVLSDGRADQVSLQDAFQRGHEIRDLAVRPHERIALMRLLLCVAHAALDGPNNHADWQTCAPLLPAATTEYLEKWRHAFELFGDGQRFLQVTDLMSVKAKADDVGNSISKFDLALATGNNSTLFDNAGGSERLFPPAWTALSLLTFQNFSPGGLIGDVQWNGVARGRSSNHAPGVIQSMAHAFLKGKSLADSVYLNLLPKEMLAQRNVTWGKPVWENPPSAADDEPAVTNARRSFLGRLVPLSRLVWLDGRGGMMLGNGLDYEGFPAWREATATVQKGKEGRRLFSATPSKGLWRELAAVSVLEHAGREPLGGPLALANCQGQDCDVWIGALMADKAKLEDAVESVFHLPAAMFNTHGQTLYQNGVKEAEGGATKLDNAIWAYHNELKDKLDGDQRKRGKKVKQKAATHYWTAVEQRLPDLLAVVEKPELLVANHESKENWRQTAWGKAIFAAARAAYVLACPHETPRQLKAYAFGLKALLQERSHEEATDDQEEEGKDK